MPKIDLDNIRKQLEERLRGLGAKVAEIEGDLLVGAPVDDEPHDLELTRGEQVNVFLGRSADL